MRAAGICLLALLLLSCGEYDMAIADNEYWCQMVDDGYWGASPEEYVRKCPK